LSFNFSTVEGREGVMGTNQEFYCRPDKLAEASLVGGFDIDEDFDIGDAGLVSHCDVYFEITAVPAAIPLRL
jgi:hypothetical protein